MSLSKFLSTQTCCSFVFVFVYSQTLFLTLFRRLVNLVKLQTSCKKLLLLNELMDHSGNYVLTALPFILSLLQRGLGERIHLLAHSLPQDPEVDSLPITFPLVGQIVLHRTGWFTYQSIPKQSVYVVIICVNGFAVAIGQCTS